MGCTKAVTNNWDIRLSVSVKALSANISWTAEHIHIIELALKSTHQSVGTIYNVSQSNKLSRSQEVDLVPFLFFYFIFYLISFFLFLAFRVSDNTGHMVHRRV